MENETSILLLTTDDVMLPDVADDNTTSATVSDVTADFTTSIRKHMSKIFLQTTDAQGIAGAFAFSAMIITCWQVRQQ